MRVSSWDPPGSGSDSPLPLKTLINRTSFSLSSSPGPPPPPPPPPLPLKTLSAPLLSLPPAVSPLASRSLSREPRHGPVGTTQETRRTALDNAGQRCASLDSPGQRRTALRIAGQGWTTPDSAAHRWTGLGRGAAGSYRAQRSPRPGGLPPLGVAGSRGRGSAGGKFNSGSPRLAWSPAAGLGSGLHVRARGHASEVRDAR